MADRHFYPIPLVVLVVLILGCLGWVPCASPRGGAGVGITCDGDSVGPGGTQTSLNFVLRTTDVWRINTDIQLLVSQTFADNGYPLSNDDINGFAFHVDSIVSNEYGFPEHDFGLIFDYFANASHTYGDPAWGSGQNVVLFEDSTQVQISERNHADFYLAVHGVDIGPKDKPVTGGQYTSYWTDPDEDPGPEEWHFNSFHGTDGDSGKADGKADWYVSGSEANLRFNHEYQHLCFASHTGQLDNPWATELFSTAAEYLSGVTSTSFGWQPIYDVPCDQTLLHYMDGRNPYAMWRLFATYLLHQFNVDESDYADDLLYKWVTTSTGSPTYRTMSQLAYELFNHPWGWKVSGTTGFAKLCSLFQDWSIAKAVDDTTRFAPDDSITLGFGRGLSPYEDVGLFRDVVPGCGSRNSGVLPNEHVIADSCEDRLTWVEEYIHPSDLPCTTAAADNVTLRVWSADYILFKPDPAATLFGTGEPYDLKILLRGREGNALPYASSPGEQRLQVALVTYSSAESVFQSAEDVIEIRKVSVVPDSGKAVVTVHGFGDTVKAALVIAGLTAPESDLNSAVYVPWEYKYGYTVEKHWKSGAVPWSVTWFDSIHVNGDVWVQEDKTVTIEPGTMVEVFPGDVLDSGLAPDRSELILSGHAAGTGGRLVAEGALNDTILFTSGAGNPGNADWYGVRMMEGCSPFRPKYCKFEHAAYPIVCMGDTLTVKRCFFGSFNNVGIYAGDTSCITVDTTRIDMGSSSQYGIQLLGGSSGNIVGNTIEGGGGAVGVWVGTGSSATVSHNTISGPYTGIEASGESVTASYNSISDFLNAGIKVTGSEVSASYDTIDIGSTGVTGIELVDCSAGEVSHNVITGSSSGMRYGMKCSGSTSATVSYNKFENVLAGMKIYGNSGVDVNHNVFSDNASTGMSVEGTSWAGVAHNSITGYAYYGVAVKNSAEADMGTYPDSGSNRIFTESVWTDYCVMNKTSMVVKAECNWWGTSQPTQSLFYGPVDWSPYLGSDPGLPFALKMPGRVLGVPPLAYTVQNYPNPLNPVTTIEYGVPENGARVTLRVFDVSGRVVRVLVDGTRPAGVHVVSWDGSGDDGRRVASGVYLYEAAIGEYRVTKKMVVLR